jgi:hypothetical protein
VSFSLFVVLHGGIGESRIDRFVGTATIGHFLLFFEGEFGESFVLDGRRSFVASIAIAAMVVV